jgi:uncharacterized Zn-finger protein
LVVHARSHTGERPFSCTVAGCKFAAAKRGDLAAHARTHTGERPFVCAERGCGFAAAQRGDLRVHSRTHTGERPFSCRDSRCPFSATTSSGLAVHLRRMHAGGGGGAPQAPAHLAPAHFPAAVLAAGSNAPFSFLAAAAAGRAP